MKAENIQTYCLFCKSGQENRVIEKLKSDGYAPFAPLVVRWKPLNGKIRQTRSRLLPGYVFFDAEALPNWQNIYAIEPVLRILQYDDGERILRGSDAEFVAWLKKYDGTIQLSHVIQVGTKLEFIDGPLKEMEGKIIKVNKSRKQVQVAIGNDKSMMHTIWCSIDYIEANTDTDILSRDVD